MPLEIVTVPCRTDNYAYLVHDSDSGETALVDIPEAQPILDTLDSRGWTLSQIWITHHHPDHVEGLSGVLERHPAPVTGGRDDAHRLPPLDRQVAEGDTLEIAGHEGHVIDVSGHTVGHLAFHFPTMQAAFTADSLMAWGCGRVFEGSMDMMHVSLEKLAALPPETQIYSGHEYTTANGKFALSIEPDNPALISRMKEVEAARADNRPTVPVPLSLELETNPFLRADTPQVRAAVGLPDAPASEVFAAVRMRKDNF